MMRFFPLALCVALAACGNHDDSTRSMTTHIMNGKPDPGHPAVGSLSGGADFCTATLLGPKTALVAAHCITGTAPYTFTVGGKSYVVDKLKPHSGWKTVKGMPDFPTADWTFSIHDIAIMILAEPVTNVKPLRIATKKPAVGAKVILVGFGGTGKSKADNMVGAIGKEFICYGTMAGMKGTNGLTCTGDSGGPTLIMEDGEEKVLGVHSMSNCINYTQDTRVSTHMAWLKVQSSEIKDPPDSGTLPQPDAGTPDIRIPDTGVPAVDSTIVGLEPTVDPEPDEGCSVGTARGGAPALLLLVLLLGLATVRRR